MMTKKIIGVPTSKNKSIVNTAGRNSELEINNKKKIKRSTKFYIAYFFAILAWFSYSSFSGIEMMDWEKSKPWQAKGSQHQSGKLYSHK